jgi:hypothetical protein
MDDINNGGDDESSRPISAYHQFNRLKSLAIKEELIAQGET